MDEPMGTSVSSELPAPLDCPGSHGLSDVTTHGYARCDACSRTLNATEMIRACRSCNWGVCPDCLSSAPRGARKPHMDIGSCCRAEWRGKPIRAVVVDTREAEGRSEVLLHYPGQSAEAHDEWIDVTSQRIVPWTPPQHQQNSTLPTGLDLPLYACSVDPRSGRSVLLKLSSLEAAVGTLQ